MQNVTNLPRSVWIGGGIALVLLVCALCIGPPLAIGLGFKAHDAQQDDPDKPALPQYAPAPPKIEKGP